MWRERESYAWHRLVGDDRVYSGGMNRSPLTLAALATSAVPDLEVSGYRQLNADHPHEVSAVLETNRGLVFVQLPLSPVAEVHHSAKIMGQVALTQGARASLPFTAPEVLGVTRSGDTRVIVSTYLEGERFDVTDLTHDSDLPLLGAVGESIAAIHRLPLSVVTDQGLRNSSAASVRSEASRLVDQAYRTGLMPELVYQHWLRLLGDAPLWDFQPCVIHGSLSDGTLLLAGDQVAAVLDWAELSVGDPAQDFAWLCGTDARVLELVIEQYDQLHPSNHVGTMSKRAAFWNELQVAKWLLHGIEQHDEQIIDDATTMFDDLVPRASRSLASDTPEPERYSATEVLEQIPESAKSLRETDRFDPFDDDEMYGNENDFSDEDITDDDPDETKPVKPIKS